MSVLEIVTAYLKEHGYDGLYDDDGECGCLLDDLGPCCMMSEKCCAGYKGECNCGEGCDWHVGDPRPAQGVTSGKGDTIDDV